MRGRRLTWLAGGIGLIGSGVFGMSTGALSGVPGASTVITLLSDLSWAAAILLLAIGLVREDSVVARKPLGITAAAVVSLWPATDTLVSLATGSQLGPDAAFWPIWSYLSWVVPLMFGLIAAMQVARAGVVPTPWNWAPLWALGIRTVTSLIPALVAVASPNTFMAMGDVLPLLGTLGYVPITFGLGVLAVALSTRTRSATVPVFDSSAAT
ncbi:hypothetical protein LC082_00120 [Microbacterium esteraromaticum]|uniref:hypothetical protein n=1 Tax=Microbacterium esteraromaticum TaxID=57043 RepID=UPI001CD1BBBB|nr:hypothetical protein [Microbacterium esteraromaticum]MCA1305300.1 hypothetical protein [Microbacterium esteraromaticum]